MNHSLLRAFLFSCSLFAVIAHADTFPSSLEVKGECVLNHSVKDLRVESISKGNVVISGIADRGAEIGLIDKNDNSRGFIGITDRNADGSFEITTSLTNQNTLEDFTLYTFPTRNRAEILCEFSFDTNQEALEKELTSNIAANIEIFPEFLEARNERKSYDTTSARSVEVTGECVQNYFVKNIEVKLLGKAKAVISGFADRGVRISVVDRNVIPLGTAANAFRGEDGFFEVTTWLRGQNDLENFSIHADTSPVSSVKLCSLNFNSNKGIIVRELTPSHQVQSDDPAIVKLANEITAGATSDVEKITLIQSWVAANIKYDYSGMANMLDNATGWSFPSAARTLERRSGICSETSMLSGALVRAAGIPNRMITGTFHGGGHQWNEAYLDGAWVTYEAQLPFDSVKNWDAYKAYGVSWRL